MRIGNVRIAGLSKRFYFLVAFVVVLVFALLALAPKPPVNNAAVRPAFPESALTTPLLQSSGWVGKFISAYGLFSPTQQGDFVGTSYFQNVGLPMRFNAYVYNPSVVGPIRPDLLATADNYTFEPALFLAPNQPVSLNNLASSDPSSALDSQPLLLGFRNSAVPAPGNAYEVTGLLWWRSDIFSATAPSAADLAITGPQFASPVIIVDSYTQLSPEELLAPSTQRVDLNLNYQEGGIALDLNRVEWSSGNELRVCLGVHNTTDQTIPMWAGTSEMTADNGQGTVTGVPDATSALSTTTSLQPYQSVSGYVVFGASVSDPTQPLTLRMPTLQTSVGSSQAQDSIIINIPSQAIQNVAAVQAPTTNCDASA